LNCLIYFDEYGVSNIHFYSHNHQQSVFATFYGLDVTRAYNTLNCLIRRDENNYNNIGHRNNVKTSPSSFRVLLAGAPKSLLRGFILFYDKVITFSLSPPFHLRFNSSILFVKCYFIMVKSETHQLVFFLFFAAFRIIIWYR
jgi:hypothetical protein